MIHTSYKSYSRNQFLRDVENCTGFLKDSKVEAGNRIALTSDNSYSFMVVFFSLVKLDCSIVLVDCMMGEKEVKRIIEDSGAVFCISDRTLSSIKKVPVRLLDMDINLRNRNLSPEVMDSSFKKWSDRKDALILYTSGSSGNSKGIIKSGHSFLTNLECTIEKMRYYSSDVLLPVIPFTHFYGLSLIFVWWFVDCSIVLTNYRKVRSIVKAIEDHQVTVVDAIPSTYYVLAELLKKRRETLDLIRGSSVRMWCIGGSPLSSKLAEEFHQVTGKPLLDGYGLSEVGNIALNTSDYLQGCGLPLPGIQLKIVDEAGQEVNREESGEILVKSPGLMEGYLGLHKETDSAFLDGWFRTNDLGYLNEDGNLFIIGRKGNAFLRKGYVVYPASIEKKLSDSLGLKGKIVTFDDAKKDSYVLLMIESPPQEEASLRRAILDEIEPVYQPDRIVFLGSFPLLNNGKIDLISLKFLALKWSKHRLEEEECLTQ
ncbi:class I adenylate-forming enzyme family protein [Peribacillus frigoritolerans]|uniref:class I adenylate-forming enzyme family protein n=1 Tax=Peribacillus frigoritolerans TaxID=450367 RepID=UPI0023DB8317|nr:class I adenylate-forming enzyme family protein [Peribacillus frigoritolerans]MDF1999845.1 class I adenylate-forming enzyme family protein [Peribacillus frigoritolerans]